jgi:peptidoglycan/LPS O-acetylase OafA/YrhL
MKSSPGNLADDQLRSARFPRRKDIDALRALAVSAVIGFHFFPTWIKSGFIGVDVFFVISGFVITNLLIREQPPTLHGLAVFWGHRVRRLFPALIVVILVTLVASWFVLWPTLYLDLGRSALWATAMASNIFFWESTSYFVADTAANPLLNLWSLGVEEQFYLVWPLLFGALVFLFKRRVVLAIFMIALVSFASTFLLIWLGTSSDALPSLFYLPMYRAWELLAGAGLAAYFFRRPNSRFLNFSGPTRTVIYGASTALLLTLLIAPPIKLVPAVYALPAVVLTVVLIGLGSGDHQVPKVPLQAPALWLGKISYPLYLWHWPVLSIALSLGFLVEGLTAWSLVILSIFLSYGTWKLIEKPFQTRSVSKSLMAILIGLMLCIAVMAAIVVHANGFPQRARGMAAELSSFNYNYATEYRSGSCFIESGMGISEETFKECVETRPGKQNVLLWGDSHAAHLYPGLIADITPDETLTQITSSLCAPAVLIQASPRSACEVQNELATSLIANADFNEILLSAFWSEDKLPALRDTVDQLKVLTDAEIILIGPDPQWSPSLPRSWSLFEANAMSELPEYSQHGLVHARFELNDEMRFLARELGISYVDVMSALCRNRDCLVRTGPGVDSLTAWDYGHLTRAGSVRVAKAIRSSSK